MWTTILQTIYVIYMIKRVLVNELWTKLPFMIEAATSKTLYSIQPQTPPPHLKSQSAPWWLLLHLVVTCLLTLTVGLQLLFPSLTSAWEAELTLSKFFGLEVPVLVIITSLLHLVMIVFILLNATRLGPLSRPQALSINLGVLAALTYFLWNQKLFVYFCILTIPVWVTFFSSL